MNRITTAVLATALAALSCGASAGTGLAGDITIETAPFQSTRDQAEVKSELQAFKASREPNPSSFLFNPLKHFRSMTSRDQVTADYIAERSAVSALNGEDSGSAYLARHGATSTQLATRSGTPGVVDTSSRVPAVDRPRDDCAPGAMKAIRLAEPDRDRDCVFAPGNPYASSGRFERAGSRDRLQDARDAR